MTTSQRNDNNVSDEKHLEKKIIIETGKKYTASGEWEAEGPLSTIVYVSKGELMPLYCGKKVKWTLLRNG